MNNDDLHPTAASIEMLHQQIIEGSKPKPAPPPVKIVPPPRWQAAQLAKDKLARGEPLTEKERAIVVWAMPRKWRRAHKVRTTPIRDELDAMRVMRIPEGKSPDKIEG